MDALKAKSKLSVRGDSPTPSIKSGGKSSTGRFKPQRKMIKASKKKNDGKYMVAIYDMLSDVVKEHSKYFLTERKR